MVEQFVNSLIMKHFLLIISFCLYSSTTDIQAQEFTYFNKGFWICSRLQSHYFHNRWWFSCCRGTFLNSEADTASYYFAKLDNLGNTEWEKTYQLSGTSNIP